MPALTKREIAQVIGIGLGVLLVSSIPYFLGYAFAPPGTEFGGFLADLDDSYSHLAKMQQGASGGWRYQILFTPEEHPGAYLHTFYLALGKLSPLLRLSLVTVYQGARLACGLLLLLAAYLFLSMFLAGKPVRFTAYILICMSSGLGWLVLLSGSFTLRGISPMDFWLMDAYTFFTLFTFPHASAATALLLLFFTLVLTYFATYRFPILILAGITVLALCVIHPFAALLVDSVLLTYWASLFLKRKHVPRREGLAIVTWALTPIPLMAYYYRAFTIDPVFRSWSAQNILPSPPVPHLLLGYGLILLLALGGIANVIRTRDERRFLLVSWTLAAVILLYLPFGLQRRMIEGLHVPLCILATIGLFEYALPATLSSRWLNRVARWRGYGTNPLRRLLVYSVIVATLPSNLYLLAGYSVAALQNAPSLYYQRAEVDAVDWLRENTQRSDTVLASYQIGRFIPARAGNRVFIGHWCETVDLEHKKSLAESFFRQSTSDEARRELLAEYAIRYVFYGPSERQLGGFDPSATHYLTRVYSDSDVAIYAVDSAKLLTLKVTQGSRASASVQGLQHGPSGRVQTILSLLPKAPVAIGRKGTAA